MDKPREMARAIAAQIVKDFQDAGHPFYDELIQPIADALAERERAARTDALEQACKAVCRQCKHGRKLKLVDGVWSHGVLTPGLQWKPCAAAAIRALINEVTPCSNG